MKIYNKPLVYSSFFSSSEMFIIDSIIKWGKPTINVVSGASELYYVIHLYSYQPLKMPYGVSKEIWFPTPLSPLPTPLDFFPSSQRKKSCWCTTFSSAASTYVKHIRTHIHLGCITMSIPQFYLEVITE